MEKHELLKKIGFSEEYISLLKKFENNQDYAFEVFEEEYTQQSFDMPNIVIDESINNFTTRLVVHRK